MKTINIELYEEELNYILTGLELFSLNLNNIWAVKKDTDEQELRYHVIFYLYQRLLSYSSDFDNFDYENDYCKIKDFTIQEMPKDLIYQLMGGENEKI